MSIPDVRPQTVETPETPAPRVPYDLFLSPERGWFRALRHPQFRFFWTGNFVSNVGTWMQNVAQGWLVLSLTDSPLWLGVVGFAQQVPALLFSLLGGVIADRTERRRLLLITQSIMMIIAVALTTLTALGLVTVNHVLLLAFLAGTTMAINAPTYQAAVRDLVESEDTLNAIALNSIQFNMSRVLGPPLAGFLIAGLGMAACFGLNALSYIVLLLVIWHVKFPPRQKPERTTIRAEMVEGFRYVWTHRPILWLVVIVAMVSMFGLPYLVMLPAFARDVLQVGPLGLGYLGAAAGVGALAGGVQLAARSHHRRGRLVVVATVCFFMALVLFCLSRDPIVSALLMALVGAAMVSSVATVNSLIQTKVPDHIRGRVLSMHTMAFLGFTPLGSLLVGALAETWGPPLALAISSGFALALTILIALAVPAIRRLQ